MLGAFAQSVRCKEHSKSSKGNAHLVADTCKAAVSHVCQAFLASGRPNPSLDEDGKTVHLLQRQFKGYKNADPKSGQQKPIPLELLLQMTQRKTKDAGLIAFYQLIILAFFFAMRSCEYLKIPKGERRTKTLCLDNLAFRKNKKFLSHDDPNLHLADSVTVTFVLQKKAITHDQVTHSRSGDDEACPVVAAAAIVKRLKAMGATKETEIYKYQDNKGVVREMTNTVALRFDRR
jgi:hypothetical protein